MLQLLEVYETMAIFLTCMLSQYEQSEAPVRVAGTMSTVVGCHKVCQVLIWMDWSERCKMGRRSKGSKCAIVIRKCYHDVIP